MPSVVMLSVVMLSVIMLNIVMLSVVTPLNRELHSGELQKHKAKVEKTKSNKRSSL